MGKYVLTLLVGVVLGYAVANKYAFEFVVEVK